VLSACSGDGDAEGAVATTTTGQAPATTTTRPSAADTKAAVLAAYRAFWDDVVAVGKTADWQSPRLAEHATGKALDQLRGQFRALRLQGWVARGTIKVAPRIAGPIGRKATCRLASTPAGTAGTTRKGGSGWTSSAASRIGIGTR
jgi:hypothetical protein